MGAINIQKQGGELLIRVKADELDFAFIKKLSEQIFWEYALQKAGFNEADIDKIFLEKDQSSVLAPTLQPGQKEPSDEQIEAWTDAIQSEWWGKNGQKFYLGIQDSASKIRSNPAYSQEGL
ncbi:MAG: hypothetical protein ACKVUS_03740 [Saprospiraceae bacterium]